MKRRDVPFLCFTKCGSVLANAANLYYFIYYFIRIFPSFINAANLYYFIFIHIWPAFINAAKLFYELKKMINFNHYSVKINGKIIERNEKKPNHNIEQ